MYDDMIRSSSIHINSEYGTPYELYEHIYDMNTRLLLLLLFIASLNFEVINIIMVSRCTYNLHQRLEGAERCTHKSPCGDKQMNE